jgi:hypothetical protein
MGARATTTNLALANVKNAGKLRTLLEKLSLNDKEEGQHVVEEEEKEEEDQQEEGEGARVSNSVSRAPRNGSEENLGLSSVHVLPNDILTLIFARLPRATLSAIRLTCSTWKRLCQHQDIAVLRRQMGVAEGWIYVLAEKPAGSSFRVFDPQANKWSMLPPIAGHSLQENWQGFACVAVGHKLILMGGRYVDTTTSMHHSSGSNLPQVLRVTSTIIHTWALVVISQMSPLMGGWGAGIVVSSIQHWIYITLEHLNEPPLVFGCLTCVTFAREVPYGCYISY